MHRILLLGAGKIGRMIAKFLTSTTDFRVVVADDNRESLALVAAQSGAQTACIDAGNPAELFPLCHGQQAVISALSYHFNPQVAQAALEAGASYFDLTEDIATTRAVRKIAEQARPGQIFMPQCGLAPGFVSIVANHLTRFFDQLDSVYMRVGALPQFPTNALRYNLTWSTDGLINEYCNFCEVIHEGRLLEVLPLEGLEHFSLDGVRYEAFNTSGGLGTLCETLAGKVRTLNYKTVRYNGHRDLMQFLIGELRLSERRELLKDLLETAIPITMQDVVVVFCTVTGRRQGQLVQTSDARKIYQQTIDGEVWSAIQVTTAAGVCSVVDLHFAGQLSAGEPAITGFVRQEQVDCPRLLANRFGKYYDRALSLPLVESALDVTDASRVA
ncbi:MAG TPA: saccharopine dehydrogenase NADP-binding domain-containing protein [Pirellulales bacterium]|jgi:saccharopine dehydrogenase-like NADP-dependent oxidoreductase|nr:saccharopine dehydrogenase NADP-binding domain-containing protein [Pirellulales bacterium]